MHIYHVLGSLIMKQLKYYIKCSGDKDNFAAFMDDETL